MPKISKIKKPNKIKIPNKTTLKAFKDSDIGENMKSFKAIKELRKDLND